MTWVLFDDDASVDRVLRFFNDGDANIYGTAFAVSTIDICLQGEGDGSTTRSVVGGGRRRQSVRHRHCLSTVFSPPFFAETVPFLVVLQEVARSSIRAVIDINAREEERRQVGLGAGGVPLWLPPPDCVLA